MAKRRPQPEESGGGEWLATYGDLVTLLLCFFVLLFSMSTIDAAKFEMLVQAFTSSGQTMSDLVIATDGSEGIEGDAKPGETGALEGLGNSEELSEMVTNFDDMEAFIQLIITETEIADMVEVAKDGENTIMIRFKDEMMFEPNTAILTTTAYQALSPIGEALVAMEEYIEVIRVDGHVNADPNDNTKFSWDLSTNRANTVLFYMADEKGFDPTRMFSMGFAQYMPLENPNGTEEERAANRRVELYIKRKGMDLSDPDLLMDYFTMGFDVYDHEDGLVGQEIFD